MAIISGGKVIEGVGDRAELNTVLSNIPQPAQADVLAAATLADVITAFNALLAKLRAAGIITR